MNRQKIEFPPKGLEGDRMLTGLRAHRSMDVPWRNGPGILLFAGNLVSLTWKEWPPANQYK